jgi:hypothetical protein
MSTSLLPTGRQPHEGSWWGRPGGLLTGIKAVAAGGHGSKAGAVAHGRE